MISLYRIIGWIKRKSTCLACMITLGFAVLATKSVAVISPLSQQSYGEALRIETSAVPRRLDLPGKVGRKVLEAPPQDLRGRWISLEGRPAQLTTEDLGEEGNKIGIVFADYGFDRDGNLIEGWSEEQKTMMQEFITKMYPVVEELYGLRATS